MTLAPPTSHMAYCVPDLYLDGVVADGYVPGSELYPERGFMIALEPALGEPEEEAGLADAWMVIGVLESPMMMNLNMKS
jgi:hypothetical protein